MPMMHCEDVSIGFILRLQRTKKNGHDVSDVGVDRFCKMMQFVNLQEDKHYNVMWRWML
jgi:hypothetical protein